MPIPEDRGGGDDLRRAREILGAILDVQDEFLSEVSRETLFSRILEKFLRLSGAEIGFLGEVIIPAWGTPYLKVLATSFPKEDVETQKLMEAYARKGMEFRDLGNLIGAVIATGRPVISNAPAADGGLGALPPGHPRLASYAGIPVMRASGMLGILGLGNRPAGFDEGLVEDLRPLTMTFANLIEAFRLDRRRQRVERALTESAARTRRIFEHSAYGIELYDHEGCMIDTNRANVEIFGAKGKETLMGFRLFEDPNLTDEIKAKIRAGEVCSIEMDFDFEKVKANRLYETSKAGLAKLDVNIIPLQRVTGSPLGYIVEVRDITARRAAEEGLRRSLREKEVLLREIHHRVKNNLQIISSLLSLQASGLQDPGIVTLFKESRDRIRSIALVHERLYKSADLSNIDFSEYLRGLTTHLAQTCRVDSGRVRLVLDCEAAQVDINRAVPLGLIVNELVTNAFKHAFPEERTGEVTIAFKAVPGNRMMLVAADDGVGLPEGLDIQQGSTLGLQIVSLLSGQLGGTLEVITSPGAGTRFEIAFPAGTAGAVN